MHIGYMLSVILICCEYLTVSHLCHARQPSEVHPSAQHFQQHLADNRTSFHSKYTPSFSPHIKIDSSDLGHVPPNLILNQGLLIHPKKSKTYVALSKEIESTQQRNIVEKMVSGESLSLPEAIWAGDNLLSSLCDSHIMAGIKVVRIPSIPEYNIGATTAMPMEKGTLLLPSYGFVSYIDNTFRGNLPGDPSYSSRLYDGVNDNDLGNIFAGEFDPNLFLIYSRELNSPQKGYSPGSLINHSRIDPSVKPVTLFKSNSLTIFPIRLHILTRNMAPGELVLKDYGDAGIRHQALENWIDLDATTETTSFNAN